MEGGREASASLLNTCINKWILYLVGNALPTFRLVESDGDALFLEPLETLQLRVIQRLRIDLEDLIGTHIMVVDSDRW